MRRIALLAAAVAVLGLVGAAAAPAAEKERTGTRISLFAGGLQVFPANQPFHFSHGWLRVLGADQGAPPPANGRYGFSLAVDGVERRADFVDRTPMDHPVLGRVKQSTAVHNFPAGMTGTHTFTGHWFGPCTGVVDGGLAPGPCEHPTELTTAIAPLTITVLFMP